MDKPLPLAATLPLPAYVSASRFEAAREKIFAAEWLLVGREEAQFGDAIRHLCDFPLAKLKTGHGYCAPMERASQDIHRYITARPGPV